MPSPFLEGFFGMQDRYRASNEAEFEHARQLADQLVAQHREQREQDTFGLQRPVMEAAGRAVTPGTPEYGHAEEARGLAKKKTEADIAAQEGKGSAATEGLFVKIIQALSTGGYAPDAISTHAPKLMNMIKPGTISEPTMGPVTPGMNIEIGGPPAGAPQGPAPWSVPWLMQQGDVGQPQDQGAGPKGPGNAFGAAAFGQGFGQGQSGFDTSQMNPKAQMSAARLTTATPWQQYRMQMTPIEHEMRWMDIQGRAEGRKDLKDFRTQTIADTKARLAEEIRWHGLEAGWKVKDQQVANAHLVLSQRGANREDRALALREIEWINDPQAYNLQVQQARMEETNITDTMTRLTPKHEADKHWLATYSAVKSKGGKLFDPHTQKTVTPEALDYKIMVTGAEVDADEAAMKDLNEALTRVRKAVPMLAATRNEVKGTAIRAIGPGGGPARGLTALDPNASPPPPGSLARMTGGMPGARGAAKSKASDPNAALKAALRDAIAKAKAER